jgi:antitoxin HicB
MMISATYPVELTAEGPNAFIVEFPDVPGILTCGRDVQNALFWARDALLVAIASFMDQRLDIPLPSIPTPDQYSVALPSIAMMKVALYKGMREQGMTEAQLSTKLRCDPKQVRRLLDLDHNTRLDQLERALQVVGKKVTLGIVDLPGRQSV